MLRKILKNKKAQNTAEYAILISLVVAGIVAIQTYAQRALQARVKDASDLMTSVDGGTDATAWTQASTTGMGFESTQQYEPYYMNSTYNVDRQDYEEKILTNEDSRWLSNSIRTRQKGGYQNTVWTTNMMDLEN